MTSKTMVAEKGEIVPTDVFVPMTLTEILKNPYERTIRVYADGVYDLLHFGHVEQFKQVKNALPFAQLVVGVVTDEDTLSHKGGSTVMTHEERVKSVQLCSFVDEVIQFPPFFPTLEFAQKHEIDIVAHDAIPYEVSDNKEVIEDCYSPFKKLDRFFETQRTPMISTTDLVRRIVSRADEFRIRNEKRGVFC